MGSSVHPFSLPPLSLSLTVRRPPAHFHPSPKREGRATKKSRFWTLVSNGRKGKSLIGGAVIWLSERCQTGRIIPNSVNFVTTKAQGRINKINFRKLTNFHAKATSEGGVARAHHHGLLLFISSDSSSYFSSSSSSLPTDPRLPFTPASRRPSRSWSRRRR